MPMRDEPVSLMVNARSRMHFRLLLQVIVADLPVAHFSSPSCFPIVGITCPSDNTDFLWIGLDM